MANQNVPNHIFGGSLSLKSNTYPSASASDVTSGGFAPTFVNVGTAVTAISFGNQATATAPSVTAANTGLGAIAPNVVLCTAGGNLTITLPPATEFIGEALKIIVAGIANGGTVVVDEVDGTNLRTYTSAGGGGTTQNAVIEVYNYSLPTLTDANDYSRVFVAVTASTYTV